MTDGASSTTAPNLHDPGSDPPLAGASSRLPAVLLMEDEADAATSAGSGETDGVPDRLRPVTRPKLALLLAVAVLVPVALFTWRALHAPINFDGGMNLQVARRLADGDGYTRFYHELQVFPHDVQTNGPYIYVAALGIKLFGPGQFSYQFPNLVFIAGFAGVVFVLLRDHAVMRIIGPLVTLLAVPLIPTYGLGGLGEIPTSFFLFGAVLVLTEAVRTPQRAPLWTLAASVTFGAAIATKTFASGAAFGLAAGLLCALLAAPAWRTRWWIVISVLAAGLIPIGREVHRLAAVESLSDYRAWWADERNRISLQAGLQEPSGGGPVQTFLDHMHTLSRLVDFPAELLLVVVLVPLAWVAGMLLVRWRTDGFRRTVTDPAMARLLMIAGIAASYIGWWLLFVPENKLWMRRIIPGLLALNLLYLFLVPWFIRTVRHWRRGRTSDAARSTRRLAVAGLVAGAVVMVVTAVPYGWSTLNANMRALVEGDRPWLDATLSAADYVEEHDEMRFYGDHWWSAPTVSLMSGRGFYDLNASDFCSLDPSRDRLVWDADAQRIISPEPKTRDGALAFEEVATYGGGRISIYAVGPAPGRCG